MALVTVANLKDYMDISFSNIQEDAANIILPGLQSELETYLRRPIETGVITQTHVVSETHTPLRSTAYFYDESLDTTQTITDVAVSPTYIMYAKESPVVSVTSLTRQGPDDVSATTLTEGDDFIVHPYGFHVMAAQTQDTLTAVYTAGVDGTTVPYFKLLILRAASREVQNLHDDVVGLKDLETRDVATDVTGFTEAELKSVQRYRRRRI